MLLGGCRDFVDRRMKGLGSGRLESWNRALAGSVRFGEGLEIHRSTIVDLCSSINIPN